MPTPVLIHTHNAPAPIGAYAQAIKSNGFIFCSGQVALDPRTGKMVADTLEEQTLQVLENLQAVLASQGLEVAHIVKTTCFLKAGADFQSFARAYGSFFSRYHATPARSTVEVSRMAVADALVMIDAIAMLCDHT